MKGLRKTLLNALLMQREELLTQQDFLATLGRERPAVIITSDVSLAELAVSSHSPSWLVTPPGSEVIARIGASKLLAGRPSRWKRWTPTICDGLMLRFFSKEAAEVVRVRQRRQAIFPALWKSRHTRLPPPVEPGSIPEAFCR